MTGGQAAAPLTGLPQEWLSGHPMATGPGMFLLPFACSLLALDRGIRFARDRSRPIAALGLLPGLLLAVTAVTRLLPPQDPWPNAFVPALLVVAAHAGYRLVGGPRIEVHDTGAPRQARA